MLFHHKKLKFDKNKFDFDQILKDLFEVDELENLHETFLIEDGIKPISRDTTQNLIRFFIIK